MLLEFSDEAYSRLETDPRTDLGHSAEIVKSFRKRIQGLRAAKDERDIYALKSWRFEKLKGNRAHQRSIRLNDQFRLILEIVEREDAHYIIVVGIEDYH